MNVLYRPRNVKYFVFFVVYIYFRDPVCCRSVAVYIMAINKWNRSLSFERMDSLDKSDSHEKAFHFFYMHYVKSIAISQI